MFTPHTVTLYNKYYQDRDVKYKRTVIENCKFNPVNAVELGTIRINENDSGKVFVFEKDLSMSDYVDPKDYQGVGFTFDTESLIAIGVTGEINSVADLKGTEHYTINSVNHNNYSFAIEHHFSLGVK